MSSQKTVKKGAWAKFMHWYESYQGKKIVGAVYSLGASVVIVGALFKIMHFPGAGIMLTVGIGSDFDGDGCVVGCADASQLRNVTRELLRRGYSCDDIRKIWGGNWLRVMREVQQAAL